MSLVKKLLYLWLAFARRIATVNTYILLSVFFVLVIIPAGFIMRLIGKSPLRRKQTGSLWEKHSAVEDMETQF
jgi:hypothetical protein